MLPRIAFVPDNELSVNTFSMKELLRPGLCRVRSDPIYTVTVSMCAPISWLQFLSSSGAIIANASLVCSANETICSVRQQSFGGDVFDPCVRDLRMCTTVRKLCLLGRFHLPIYQTFALRNEVSVLCHLVSVLGGGVHASRWMLCAWMPALRAHAGRAQGKGGGLWWISP